MLSYEKGYVKLTSSSITSALGYIPYNSTNPNGYTSNTGTVTNIDTGTGLTGGPITSTGTIGLAEGYGDSVNPYASKTAKYVLAAPNTINGVPTFRKLVATDIPILDQDTAGRAGSVANSIKFDNGGGGAASGVTYNGSGAETISYNTIGAVPSGRTITAGNGLTGGGNLTGDRTLSLGTPSTITTSTTNSLTTTSHTHAISITPANIGAYNANHDGVPVDDFNLLYNEPNDVWFCINSMRYGPLNNDGDTNPSYNTSFDHCVVQQFGKDTKIQVLYITTGNVANLSKSSIFYRMQGDKWKRIATYSEIIDLQTQINNLTTTVNNKQNKMTEAVGSPFTTSGTSSINRESIVPVPNVVKAYDNIPNSTQYYKIDDYVNSLEEAIIIINDNSNLTNTKFNITVDSSYKISGPFTPNVDFTGPMILTI